MPGGLKYIPIAMTVPPQNASCVRVSLTGPQAVGNSTRGPAARRNARSVGGLVVAHDLLGDVLWHRFVPQVCATECAGAVRERSQVDRVTRDLDLRHLCAHQRAAVVADWLRTRHSAAPRRQV